MSMHKIPLTDLEREGLEKHGLARRIGKPDMLIDVFRQGVAWALASRPTPSDEVKGLEENIAVLEKDLAKRNSQMWQIGKALNPDATSLYWDDITEAAIRVITQALRPTTPPSPPSSRELLEKAAQELEAKANILLSLIGLPVCPSEIIQRDRAEQWIKAAELVRALLPQEPKEEGKS